MQRRGSDLGVVEVSAADSGALLEDQMLEQSGYTSNGRYMHTCEHAHRCACLSLSPLIPYTVCVYRGGVI